MDKMLSRFKRGLNLEVSGEEDLAGEDEDVIGGVPFGDISSV